MGQRSQIYISWNMECANGKHCHGLIARYFPWNFGERMISRARSIIEILKDQYLDNPGTFLANHEKLCRICDVNFDMRDIVMSSDILAEIREEWDGDMSHLFMQDNNDGQLYIRVTDAGIKYCFAEYKGQGLMDAGAYMTWKWQKSWDDPAAEVLSKETIQYTKDNIKVIKKMATLMTPDEVQEFLAADYSTYLGLPSQLN